MTPNPVLNKLGLSTNDRVVIFHADDIGMCHASQAAYEDLVSAGAVSSAAVMVPCSWFPATAQFCRENQAALPNLDMGVHLTLTCEWSQYRWGPVSTRDVNSGLLDDEGYFFRDCGPVQEKGVVTAVYHELAAQYDHAVAVGIEPTHIDSHMGCVFHPRLLPSYFQLAQERQVPALMMRAHALEAEQLLPHDLAGIQEILTTLEENGFPLLDHIDMMPLDQSDHRLEAAKQRLDALPAGVSYFIIHPAKDTPELRAIAPDWACRAADYQLFMSDEWRQVVAESGVKVIGWRVLRELMRAA